MLLVSLVTAVAGGAAFDLIYVMTSNSRETRSMSVYVREQLIDFGLVGYGSAAATLLFFVIALVTILCMGMMRRSVGRAADGSASAAMPAST